MTADTSRDVFAYEPDPNGGSLPPRVPPLATLDPTPQPAHGAAGFCTDHGQAVPDERVETVAQALREHRTARHVGGNGMWTVVCGCGWSAGPQPIGRDDEIHRAHQAAAVVAALDDETARLREHLALLALADSTAFPDGDVANYIARWIRDEDYPVRADGKTIRLTASDLDEEDRLVIERDAARAALDRVRALADDPFFPLVGQGRKILRAALDPEEEPDV